MIVIVSPAKTMQVHREVSRTSLPFASYTTRLTRQLASYSHEQLKDLMHISDTIAKETKDKFHAFEKEDKGSYAIEAYQGLQFQQLTNHQDKKAFANTHIRIVSALYGLLKPYDVIVPYRLEMQCKLAIDDANNLYTYWKDTLSKEMASLLDEQENPIIIDLASKEYSKVFAKELKEKMITIDFVEVGKDKQKRNSATVKKLRGQMLEYILQHQIFSPEALKEFSYDGFVYAKQASNEKQYTFHKVL